MRKKIISLIIATIMSTSLFISCSNNEPNDSTIVEQASETNNNKSDDNSSEVVENNLNESNSNDTNNDTNNDVTIDEGIESLLEDTIYMIYNKDYPNLQDKNAFKYSIKSYFTTNGYDKISNEIENFNSKMEVSDFLLTLIKEVDNIDKSNYKSTYNVRYNITVTQGKPAIYSDVIATIVLDNKNNLLIESINNGEF